MIRLYLFILLLPFVLKAQTEIKDPVKLFQGRDGAIVVFNQGTGEYTRINENRCARPYLPASTFKIPNALMGLETGVIKDENFIIKWDGIERGIKDWNRDHSLSTAMKFSVVPYFRELAKRAGMETSQKYLNLFDYGNKKIGEEADGYWLDNSLKISADEQVEFLKKMYNYKLPVSKRNIDIVKKILPGEEINNAVLKYKTGRGRNEKGEYIAWLVGYVEKGGNVYFFAFNIDTKSFRDAIPIIYDIPKNILKSLNII